MAAYVPKAAPGAKENIKIKESKSVVIPRAVFLMPWA